MAQLSLRSIWKSYGTGAKAVAVLHGIDADIADGEFVVIVGPSGCGKSTLLRIVAGLEGCNSGEVLLDGVVINTMEPAKRNMAMVFQNYALYPHMSVFDNMAYGLKIAGLQRAEIASRVESVAAILDLSTLLQRKPRELSGGQRQRVAMGRAIVRKPQVFLFDEPLSNLDAKLRSQTRLEIQKLHRQVGTTSLFVTHDQAEAMTLAQRLVVMNAGRIEQIGTPEEVYMLPATVFVARFMGAPPMNILTQTPGVAPGVLVGVRPEDWVIDPAGWPMQVDVVELLGAERLVHGQLQNQPYGELITVRLPASVTPPALGETLHISVSIEKVHYFDAETGCRLKGESTRCSPFSMGVG